MTDSQKIEVAREFISHHKRSDIQKWGHVGVLDENEILIDVYYTLEQGGYGDIRTDEEYDDDGEITYHATECEIEISGYDHKSENPFIFSWDI